jgi:outer membrane receptor for ferrienterochelin and colicins
MSEAGRLDRVVRLRALVLTCLAVVLLVQPARAGTIDLGSIEDVEALSLSELLEQPTEAVSRFARKPAESPSLVFTIDGELIELFGYRTLAEALQGVPGIHVGNDRNYGYIGIRGLSVPGDYNSRVSLLINGHRINDPVYGSAPVGSELGLPLLAVERIDLLRGGAWSVYGQDALLGAIQVVTATGASRPGLRLTSTSRAMLETTADPAERPTFALRGEDVSASYGVLARGVDVFVAGSLLYDRGLAAMYIPAFEGVEETCVGPDHQPRPCDGVVMGHDTDRAGSLFGAIRTKHLTLQVLASTRRRLTPTASYASIIGEPVTTFDQRALADVTYKSQGTAGDVIARVAVDYYGYGGSYPYDAGSEDGSLTLPDTRVDASDRTSSTMVSAELRGRYKRARLGRYLRDLEVAAGVEATASAGYQGQWDAIEPEPVWYLDRNDSARTFALSTHASGRAFGYLVGFAALRADAQPDVFGTMVNPQGGLVLDGGDHGRLRASIGRGFRAPNIYERFYVEGTDDQITNAELGPERSENLEVSAERYFGPHMRLQAVLFQQKISDLISYSTNDAGSRVFVNVGEGRARGLELGLEARWDRLRLSARYSRQHVVDEAGLLRINAPSTIAGGVLVVPLAHDRAHLGLESFFVGRRLLTDGSMLPAQNTTNVVVTLRNVIDRLDLTLGASNLFDQRNDTPGGEEHRQSSIQGDPRTLWLRLSLDLGHSR